MLPSFPVLIIFQQPLSTVLAKYTYAVEDKGISEIKRLRDLDPI